MGTSEKKSNKEEMDRRTLEWQLEAILGSLGNDSESSENNSNEEEIDQRTVEWQVEAILGSLGDDFESISPRSSASDIASRPRKESSLKEELSVPEILESKAKDPSSEPENEEVSEDEFENISIEKQDCLVEVDKYVALPEAVTVSDDTIIVPSGELNFDEELLTDTPEDFMEGDKTDFSSGDNSLGVASGEEEEGTDPVSNESISNEDFKDEFAGFLRDPDEDKTKEKKIVYRVPLCSVLFLIIGIGLLTGGLALLVVQLYNVPVPAFVEDLLKKIIA